jgi:hypothetical protein
LYRAFLIDATGHIFAVRVLNARDNASALRLAGQIQTPCHLIEVWHGTSKIGEVQPRNMIP